jgi:hypothetical protein
MKYYRFTKLVCDKDLNVYHEEPLTILTSSCPTGLLAHINELNIINSMLMMEGSRLDAVLYYETEKDRKYNAKI